MNIIETNSKFSSKFSNRSQTNYIILHHRAGNGDVTSIHTQHISRNFSGIGYHYYLRKDGSIYSGRPIGTIGAHCVNYNNKSVGICFEGNFENEKMCEVQKKAGAELVKYLKRIYRFAIVSQHKDMSATLCPGKNFPYDEIICNKISKIEQTTVNDIIWELQSNRIIHFVGFCIK